MSSFFQSAGLTVVGVALAVTGLFPNPGCPLSIAAVSEITGRCTVSSWADCFVPASGDEKCNVCDDIFGSMCLSKHAQMSCNRWFSNEGEEAYKCGTCENLCGGDEVVGCTGGSHCTQGCGTMPCGWVYQFADVIGSNSTCSP